MKQTTSLTIPIDWMEEGLKSFFDNRFWQFRILALGLVISATLLLGLNAGFIDFGFRHLYYEMLNPGSDGGFYWDDLIRQGQYPRTPIPALPGSHEANISFRLTVPLIARFLHLNVATLYALHVLAGLVFLWFSIDVAHKILKDKLLVFYFVTALMGTYIGANGYFNYIGHADAFPFLFMLLTFATRQPLLLLGFSQLAFWCDERAILNMSFVGCWYLLPVINEVFDGKTIHLKKIPAPIFWLLLSVVLYILLRQWLAYRYGLHISHGPEFTKKVLAENLTIWGNRFSMALEGLWFVVAAAFAVCVVRRDWWSVALMSAAWLLTALSSMLVIDITRSFSFGFVGLFLALRILQQHAPKHQLKQLLLVSMVVSLFFTIMFP
jgi:hypothetical protein